MNAGHPWGILRGTQGCPPWRRDGGEKGGQPSGESGGVRGGTHDTLGSCGDTSSRGSTSPNFASPPKGVRRRGGGGGRAKCHPPKTGENAEGARPTPQGPRPPRSPPPPPYLPRRRAGAEGRGAGSRATAAPWCAPGRASEATRPALHGGGEAAEQRSAEPRAPRWGRRRRGHGRGHGALRRPRRRGRAEPPPPPSGGRPASPRPVPGPRCPQGRQGRPEGGGGGGGRRGPEAGGGERAAGGRRFPPGRRWFLPELSIMQRKP